MTSAIRVGIAAVALLAGAGIVAAAESRSGSSAAQQHPSSTTGSASNAMNSVAGSDKLNAHELVDPNAKLKPAPSRPGDKQAPAPEKPSLNRKHDLSNGGVEYNKH